MKKNVNGKRLKMSCIREGGQGDIWTQTWSETVNVAIIVKRMIQSQGAADAKALRYDMLKDSGESVWLTQSEWGKGGGKQVVRSQ